jgi:long-chain acyl-CoA synthetase
VPWRPAGAGHRRGDRGDRRGGGGRAGGDDTLAALLAESHPLPQPLFDPAEGLAAILYTSGTTGRPKGAMLTHRNLLSNTRSVTTALQLHPGRDRLLLVLPMFHSFAATVGMLTPLLHGLAFAPLPRFEPTLVSATIERVGATIFLGVPSMYNLLLRLGDEQVAQWRSIRFCVSGGAAMPVEVMRRFEARFGVPVLEGDGPTECSPVTCVNPLEGVRKPASVGLPVPEVAIAIFDEGGGRLPCGKIGEICVHGPNVMKGYWGLPDATAESFFGAWLRTGDLGYLDGDGYLFIVDRKKDMIIVNGMNVYPRVVEEVLHRHPGWPRRRWWGSPTNCTERSRWPMWWPRRGWCWTPRRCGAGAATTWGGTRSRARCSCATPCRRMPPARSSSGSCARRGSWSGVSTAVNRLDGGARNRQSCHTIFPLPPV